MICKDQWTAVALARDVAKSPVQVMFQGTPIVLFRSGGQLCALDDLCPHRLAELSNGRVVSGDIECPYHGWRFDGQGRCTSVPGHTGAVPRYRVRTHSVTERDGVVFLSMGKPQSLPYTYADLGNARVVRLVESETRSTVVDVAENILDATHTHFTHQGLLRGLSARRHLVSVNVTGGPGWVEACYTGEDRQHGLVSRLLEGTRTKTIGRFKHPGIAEIEYWGTQGPVLVTSFHLRQCPADTVRGIGFLVGPGNGALAHLKALLFKPLFNIAVGQDRRVLQSAFDNAKQHGRPKIVNGPLDFLREDIELILSGNLPKAAEQPRHYDMEL